MSDLEFDAYATVNITAFANLATYLGKARTPDWAGGLRVGISVTNLLKVRPDVGNSAGAVPLNCQPAYLKPIGRAANLSLRIVY